MTGLIWFGAVGATAAAVHVATVWLLVSRFGMPALWANVLGFALAFCVSFTGHHRLSFATQDAQVRHALPRFALVALTGFASNELLYAVLLHFGLEYRVALVLVLVLVAGMTWVLSRHWAFKRRSA